ncbi:hypothetical protein [Butyrivibrio sp. WCD3002]|uniref:hypothetical protein n=1 Tax=Butyrivibrio sp. WCD3002 TaxID=1280676 RepID=UPI00041FD6A1|nr:hypothetical protein [Butyrivibrio sp. WCD3002]
MPKRYAATNLVEDIEEADRKKLWDTATSTDKEIQRGNGYQNIIKAGNQLSKYKGEMCSQMIYDTFEGVPGMSDEISDQLSTNMLNYLLKNVIVEKDGQKMNYAAAYGIPFGTSRDYSYFGDGNEQKYINSVLAHMAINMTDGDLAQGKIKMSVMINNEMHEIIPATPEVIKQREQEQAAAEAEKAQKEKEEAIKSGKIKEDPADNPMIEALDPDQRSAVAALRDSLMKKKKALEGTYTNRKREDNSPEYNAMKDALDNAVKATNLNNGNTLNELLSALSEADRTAKAYEKKDNITRGWSIGNGHTRLSNSRSIQKAISSFKKNPHIGVVNATNLDGLMKLEGVADKHESNRHSRIRQNSTSKQIATGEKIEGPEIKSSNIMK